MIFNNGFPINYQPAQYYQQQYTQPQNQMNQTQMIQSQSQIMNGGFISVRSIEEAYNYPVAPGNSVTFKDENAPYIYTKTMGFSQLDTPRLDKYKLVKENPTETSDLPQNEVFNAEGVNSTIEKIKSDIQAITDDIDKIKKFLKSKYEGEKNNESE